MEEIRILASFGEKPTGVAPLLSWTETYFNWQTVFPFYERDMLTAIRQAYFHVPHNDNNLRVASRALLKGMDYIHSRRVVHCDVKPNNVLLSAAGEAVLGDFGGARELRSDVEQGHVAMEPLEEADRFNADTLATTYQYRAPELFLDPPEFGYAADVWALGVTIIQCDVGKPPFGGFPVRKATVSLVLLDALKTVSTWRPPASFSYEESRDSAVGELRHILWSLAQNRPMTQFPWGAMRHESFRRLTQLFVTVRPDQRPSASQLFLRMELYMPRGPP